VMRAKKPKIKKEIMEWLKERRKTYVSQKK
jgi:hypothetical protein